MLASYQGIIGTRCYAFSPDNKTNTTNSLNMLKKDFHYLGHVDCCDD